jgi:hypothetical protein
MTSSPQNRACNFHCTRLKQVICFTGLQPLARAPVVTFTGKASI